MDRVPLTFFCKHFTSWWIHIRFLDVESLKEDDGGFNENVDPSHLRLILNSRRRIVFKDRAAGRIKSNNLREDINL